MKAKLIATPARRFFERVKGLKPVVTIRRFYTYERIKWYLNNTDKITLVNAHKLQVDLKYMTGGQQSSVFSRLDKDILMYLLKNVSSNLGRSRIFPHLGNYGESIDIVVESFTQPLFLKLLRQSVDLKNLNHKHYLTLLERFSLKGMIEVIDLAFAEDGLSDRIIIPLVHKFANDPGLLSLYRKFPDVNYSHVQLFLDQMDYYDRLEFVKEINFDSFSKAEGLSLLYRVFSRMHDGRLTKYDFSFTRFPDYYRLPSYQRDLLRPSALIKRFQTLGLLDENQGVIFNHDTLSTLEAESLPDFAKDRLAVAFAFSQENAVVPLLEFLSEKKMFVFDILDADSGLEIRRFMLMLLRKVTPRSVIDVLSYIDHLDFDVLFSALSITDPDYILALYNLILPQLPTLAQFDNNMDRFFHFRRLHLQLLNKVSDAHVFALYEKFEKPSPVVMKWDKSNLNSKHDGFAIETRLYLQSLHLVLAWRGVSYHRLSKVDQKLLSGGSANAYLRTMPVEDLNEMFWLISYNERRVLDRNAFIVIDRVSEGDLIRLIEEIDLLTLSDGIIRRFMERFVRDKLSLLDHVEIKKIADEASRRRLSGLFLPLLST
jgi:hypothetical protein